MASVKSSSNFFSPKMNESTDVNIIFMQIFISIDLKKNNFSVRESKLH